MAWIRAIGKSEAAGLLRELYEKLAPGEEIVDHILAVHSLNPESLRAHFELYRTLLYGPSPLSRRERELVAVAVSAANRCSY
jgi:alkylhydroperoxidase family enzyme